MSDCLTCKQLVEFLAEYLDGEMDESMRAQFEQHVDMCPPCKDYLKTYRETLRMCRSTCNDEQKKPGPVPPELVQVILSTLKQEGRGKS